jgi:hypothetical protein
VTDLGLLLWTALLIAIAGVPLVLIMIAFLHAARTPQWVWAFTARTQVVWMALLLGGVAIIPAGLPLAAWYWFRVRPELLAVERGDFEATRGE